jgi:hypothetical protein
MLILLLCLSIFFLKLVCSKWHIKQGVDGLRVFFFPQSNCHFLTYQRSKTGLILGYMPIVYNGKTTMSYFNVDIC